MKRFFLGLSLMLVSTTSQAFESGIYQCNVPIIGKITFILKPNGRAKKIVFGITERGYWRYEDDEALVIKETTVLEKQGKKYLLSMEGVTLGSPSPCIKTNPYPRL